MADPQAPRPVRSRPVVRSVASVDGRVSLGPGRTGFGEVVAVGVGDGAA